MSQEKEWAKEVGLEGICGEFRGEATGSLVLVIASDRMNVKERPATFLRVKRDRLKNHY